MNRRRDDRAVLDAARAGDPDTWEAMYRGVYPRLFAFARRRLATEEQAEDAVSETMVRAMTGSAGTGRVRPASTVGCSGSPATSSWRPTAPARGPAPPTRTHRRPAAGLGPGPEATVLADEERATLCGPSAGSPRDDQDLLEQKVVAGLDATQIGALTDRSPGPSGRPSRARWRGCASSSRD